MPIKGHQIKVSNISLDRINPSTNQILTLLGNTKIQQNQSPISGIDLVNKDYVDSIAQGITGKSSCRVATISNIDIVNSPSTIDGITLNINDRILIKDQILGYENGIYVFNGSGNALTRSLDVNEDIEIKSGLFTFIKEGTLADTGWLLSTNDTIVLDTTPLTFIQFSSAGITTSSNGLTKIGNDIQLGGLLTSNTLITGVNETFEIVLGDTQNINSLYLDNGEHSIDIQNLVNDFNISHTISNLVILSRIRDNNTNNINSFILSTQGINITDGSTNNRMVIKDEIINKGLVYDDYYESNFTELSLVSKIYVDDSISNLTTSLTTNYVPYWNGNSLVDSPISVISQGVVITGNTTVGTSIIKIVDGYGTNFIKADVGGFIQISQQFGPNVNIGPAPTAPTAQLEIQRDSSQNGQNIGLTNLEAGNNKRYFIGIQAVTNTLRIYDDTLSTERINLYSNGHFTINGMTVDYGGGLQVYNVAIGYKALELNTSNRNVAIGWMASYANSTSGNNTAVGYSALTNNIGTRNTAIGSDTLVNNTIGSQNIAIGSGSLGANTIGNGNVAIGSYNTLYSNLIGNYNIAIGDYASANQNNVDGNISIGYASLYTNINGSQNIAIGLNSLKLNVNGGANTSIGYYAGYNNTGSYNTFLGSLTDVSTSGITNSTAIGYGVILTNSNTLLLGNNANVGIGISNPLAKLELNGRTSDNTAYAISINDSTSFALFKVRNDGQIESLPTYNDSTNSGTSSILGIDDTGKLFNTGISSILSAPSLTNVLTSGSKMNNSQQIESLNGLSSMFTHNFESYIGTQFGFLDIQDSDGFILSFEDTVNVTGLTKITGFEGVLELKADNNINLVGAPLHYEQIPGITYDIQSNTTGTNNNISTILSSIPIALDSILLVEARVHARKTGGLGVGTIGDGNTYIRTVKVKNVGGVLSIGSISSTYTSEDITSCFITYTISGSNLNLVVTGSPSNNITWTATSIITK